MNDTESSPIKVVSVTALESITRGEVDVQITTAKKFPRNLKQCIDDATTLATLDEATAGECMYALQRGGKKIEGGSIRLAEIIAASWGNLRIARRVVSVDARTITAQAVVHDLEKNVAWSAEVTRRITKKDGTRYDDDMIAVTANAAQSIAARNAVFAVIPKPVWKPIYEAAKDVAIGKAEALSDKRHAMVAHFAKMGVTLDRILATMERTRLEDITRDDLATLKGFASAIISGEASLDETFPAVDAGKGAATPTDDAAARLAATATAKTETKAAAEPQATETKAPTPPPKDETPVSMKRFEEIRKAFTAQTDAVKSELRSQFAFKLITDIKGWTAQQAEDLWHAIPGSAA